uniref:Ycf1 n=1 Tax=Sinomenium acutum TaxID=152363 RepID=A0A6G9DXW9_9MAGN|nr:Ycf1 [Sinomenium acutum]QIP53864.1 Ycf1 [Sinomenium acutum]
MILKSFLLGNPLCMKIINSVVVVGFYYGFMRIYDHILDRALLSLPSSSSAYGRRNRNGGISNDRFYYRTASDVHIDLLCASASGIEYASYNNCPSSTVSFVSFLLEQPQRFFLLWIHYQKFNAYSQHSMRIPELSYFSIIQPFHFTKFNVSQISKHLYVSMQQQNVICNKYFCWLVNWSYFFNEMDWVGVLLDKTKSVYYIEYIPCVRIEKFSGENFYYSLIYHLCLLFRQNAVAYFHQETENKRNRCRNFRNKGNYTGTRRIHSRRLFPLLLFGRKGGQNRLNRRNTSEWKGKNNRYIPLSLSRNILYKYPSFLKCVSLFLSRKFYVRNTYRYQRLRSLLVCKTSCESAFRLSTMESSIAIYKKCSISECCKKSNVTIFFLYMPKSWKTKNIFYISPYFVNFFGNDTKKDVFVHDRKTLLGRTLYSLGLSQSTKKKQPEQRISQSNRSSRQGGSCSGCTRKKNYIVLLLDSTKMLTYNLSSFFERIISWNNKRIVFTLKHERSFYHPDRGFHTDRGFHRNNLAKYVSSYLYCSLPRISIDKHSQFLALNEYICRGTTTQFEKLFFIIRTRKNFSFRKSSEIFLCCSYNRFKRSNKYKKIHWTKRNPYKGSSMGIQIDRRLERTRERKSGRINRGSWHSFTKSKTCSNFYCSRAEYQYSYCSQEYYYSSSRSSFDTLFTTIRFSSRFNQRIYANSKTSNSYLGTVSIKRAFTPFFRQNRQKNLFFFFSYLRNGEFHFSEFDEERCRIQNLGLSGGRGKRKGEKNDREKRGESTDSNSRNLGYYSICSSNKRFHVSNPINSYKIYSIAFIDNSQKHWPYVTISIPRVVRRFKSVEYRNERQMHLYWCSIIRKRISEKLVNRRYSDKDLISFPSETLAQIYVTIPSYRANKKERQKSYFLFFNSLGNGSSPALWFSPKTTFLFSTHLSRISKKTYKSEKEMFSSSKNFKRKNKMVSKGLKRKNKVGYPNDSIYKNNNERAFKKKSNSIIRTERGICIYSKYKSKCKKFDDKYSDYSSIFHSNSIHGLDKLFTNRKKNNGSSSSDKCNQKSNRKNHKRQEKNIPNSRYKHYSSQEKFGSYKIRIAKKYLADIKKKKYPIHTSMELFYAISYCYSKNLHGYPFMYHKYYKDQCTTFTSIQKNNSYIQLQSSNKSRRNSGNKSKYNSFDFDYQKVAFYYYYYSSEFTDFLSPILFVTGIYILQIIPNPSYSQISLEIRTSISRNIPFFSVYNKGLFSNTRNIGFRIKAYETSQVWNDSLEKLVKRSLSLSTQFISYSMVYISTTKMAKYSQSKLSGSKQRLNQFGFIRKRPINSLPEKKSLCNGFITESKRKIQKKLQISSFITYIYELCRYSGLLSLWITITRKRGPRDSLSLQHIYSRIFLCAGGCSSYSLSKRRFYYSDGYKYRYKILSLENSSFLSYKKKRHSRLERYGYRDQHYYKYSESGSLLSNNSQDGYERSCLSRESYTNPSIQSNTKPFSLDGNESKNISFSHIQSATLVFPRVCVTLLCIYDSTVDHTNQFTSFVFYWKLKRLLKLKYQQNEKKRSSYSIESKKISLIREEKLKRKTAAGPSPRGSGIRRTKPRESCIRYIKPTKRCLRRLLGIRHYKEKTIYEKHGSRTRFIPEKIFSFSIEVGLSFESKNNQLYQGILSPALTDKSKGNCYIFYSKRRNESGCNADSERSNSLKLDNKRNLDYLTSSSVYKMGWTIYYVSNYRYFTSAYEYAPNYNYYKMPRKRKCLYEWSCLIHFTTCKDDWESRRKSLCFACSCKYFISYTPYRIENYNLFQFAKSECCGYKSSISHWEQCRELRSIFGCKQTSCYRYRYKYTPYVQILYLAKLSIRRFSLYESLLVLYQYRYSFQYVKDTYVSTIENSLMVHFPWITCQI